MLLALYLMQFPEHKVDVIWSFKSSFWNANLRNCIVSGLGRLD